MVDSDESEVEREIAPMMAAPASSHEAKLREMLHNFISLEIKLCSHATKDFIRLLKGDRGGDLLHLYVQTSPNFPELLEGWKVRQGKPGFHYVLSLISALLAHPDGKYLPDDAGRVAISRVLDKFARLILEEKLEEVNKELVSKEPKRQNAALLLLASIVRRGSGLAAEVAKKFDFKVPAFFKLAEYRRKPTDKKLKNSTRKAFVGYAMSFLEVGKPGLLRWVLQQKEMYSGVFRGLGNDDDETVIYVLSTLRDRILVEESLVPPGLRSVLFGSMTLEQLVNISGRENGGLAAELAHTVLLMVCTDPCNGLMADPKRHLRGNLKRLLDLMKKLTATEVGYHRDLLLTLVKGRPAFGSAYMEEFPYSLEDHTSPSWFAIVSLAANLVSTVGIGMPFDFLISHNHYPPSFDSMDVQNVMKCICFRPFSRSVSNKGLLHSDLLVRNGTLRLLLEELKLLDAFVIALNNNSYSNSQTMQSWTSLKQEVINEVRTFLSDPQVLLTLLSSLSSQSKSHELSLKRTAESEHFPSHSSKGAKKLKTGVNDVDTDIIIGGISSMEDVVLSGDTDKAVDIQGAEELDSGMDLTSLIAEIWGLNLSSEAFSTLEDAEIYFHSKLLDALQIYLRTMPTVLEGSFDFFINLLAKAVALPISLQHSLLSLLAEYIRWSPRSGIPIKTPPLMYKHLQPLINLLILSPVSDIQHQAYNLACASMLSTGAFDRNLHEISAWFLFLPGYNRDTSLLEDQVVEALQSFTAVLVPFLCDAISAVGNNLFKHWDVVRCYSGSLEGMKDASPTFSPFVIRVLQNCLKLLSSESGVYTVCQKTLISLYVCNTLKYILQVQVDAGLLSVLIESILMSEKLLGSEDSLCEWRPLKSLLLFSQSILHKQTCISFSDVKAGAADSSFADMLGKVGRLVENEQGQETVGITKAFSSSIICTAPEEILNNFPSVMVISRNLVGVPVSILSSMFSLEQNHLASVTKLWPQIFSPALEMSLSMFHSGGQTNDTCTALHSLHVEDVECNRNFNASEAVEAFSFFLKQIPFHVLFPAIICIDSPYSLDPSKIQELLVAKLSKCQTNILISNLRLVLFWIHQIRAYCMQEPTFKLEQLSAICFTLVDHMLVQLLGSKPGTGCVPNSKVLLSAQDVQEVAETIFCHPVVIESLISPLDNNQELAEGTIYDNQETLLNLSGQRIHKLDHHILDMLKTALGYMFSSGSCPHHGPSAEGGGNIQQMKPFTGLVQRIFSELRDRFVMCSEDKDLMAILPIFYAIHTLHHYISPFELLKLVNWMIHKVNANDLASTKSCKISAISVGFSIVGGAFRVLSGYMEQQVTERVPYDMFWGMDENFFDCNIIEDIYFEVFKFATSLEMDSAYACLLEAVNAVYRQKCMPHQNLHPLSLVLLRVVTSTPLEILSHCIHKTSMTKAKLLYLLSETSSLHLSVSGQLLLSNMSEIVRSEGDFVDEMCGSTSSDEDFMMLLPAALSYMNSMFMKYGKQHHKHFREIPSFYSGILLKGFSQWKSFVVSKQKFEEGGKVSPQSSEELLNLVNDSLLGKSVHMLRYHFYFSGDSMKMKKRLKLFNSIIHDSVTCDGLLDCDLGEVDSYAFSQAFNLANRVVAKVCLCRMLLFPEDNQINFLSSEPDGKSKKLSIGKGSDEGASARMSFLNCLVSTWHSMVKKFPSISDSSGKEKSISTLSLFRYMETYILRSILGLVTEMLDDFLDLQAIPFLEQLLKLSLLYRFEDPMTLKMLQKIVTSLSDGKFSRIPYLQLLLAHSQFAPTIISIAKSSDCSQIGAFLRPMSSILRALAIPCNIGNVQGDEISLEKTEPYKKHLEVIKLLRIFFQFNTQHVFSSEEDIGINSRELHALLLSSYGATLGEIDREIYNLMHEIESIDGLGSKKLDEMDYLWGSAALKIRKVRALEQDISSNAGPDDEAIEERRKSQFRENLPVDPKICANTVLYFPYDRTNNGPPLSSNKIELDNRKDIPEMHLHDVGNRQRYDPVFILRFSIHCLSVGYVEPVEFAGLGLLAVAFISLSSPDDGIRKLSYDCLGRFKNALEACQKKKDVMQLRLLLTYVQNGIEEAWQRIPSIVALFAAETSFILLDPSNDHYATLSKLLMHCSRMNTKSVPFFNNFFSSTSVNFKAERLWVLRLLYVGLNLDDDAQIYIRNSILEILLSFYVSPLSDSESKELIVQVVKKSVEVHKLTRYLVEHCGLFSWISSVFSDLGTRISGDEKRFVLTQMVVLLEVVNEVLLSRNVTEWLQKYALEQLTELSSQLYKIFIGSAKSLKENAILVGLILEVLMSTMKISHERKMYQPHFTLSVDGIFQMYEAVNVHDDARFSRIADFGLKSILMISPSTAILSMNKEKLSRFILWAISTALKSDSSQMHQRKKSSPHFEVISEEELSEDSMASKLLRWLTASVILGKLSWRPNVSDPNIPKMSGLKTLQSLLEYIKKAHGEGSTSVSGCEELLAAGVCYLQQSLGTSCTVLPSAASALCLLLCNSSKLSGSSSDPVDKKLFASLCSSIDLPAEAKPSWRWSYYQPWKDSSLSEKTDSGKMDEFHVCQTLSVIIANLLRNNNGSTSSFKVLRPEDLDRFGLCKLGSSIIGAE